MIYIYKCIYASHIIMQDLFDFHGLNIIILRQTNRVQMNDLGKSLNIVNKT